MRRFILFVILIGAFAPPAHAQFRELLESAVEEGYGKAGAVAYREAAIWMSQRNMKSEPLDDASKKRLRPFFRDMVDNVQVSYNSELLGEITLANQRIPLQASYGQTYCGRIFIKAKRKPDNVEQLILLAHEMVHAWQCEKYGGLDEFGFRYFRAYYQGGQTYENNNLEKAAIAFEKKFVEEWKLKRPAKDKKK